MLLNRGGVTKEKIAIMVGGPDWPTAVMCGIFNLDIGPILIAVLPCYFGSTFLTITGAMMTQPTSSSTTALTVLSLGLAAFCNMFFGMMAAIYITN